MIDWRDAKQFRKRVVGDALSPDQATPADLPHLPTCDSVLVMIGLVQPPQMIYPWSRFQVSLLALFGFTPRLQAVPGRTAVGWCNVKLLLRDGGVNPLSSMQAPLLAFIGDPQAPAPIPAPAMRRPQVFSTLRRCASERHARTSIISGPTCSQ